MLLNSEKIQYLLYNNVSKNTFTYVHLLQSLYRPTWISLYLQFASVHTPFHLFCTQKKKKRGIFLALTYVTSINTSVMIYFNLVWIKKLKSQSVFMQKLHINIRSKFLLNTDFKNPKQKLPHKETLLTYIHFSLKPYRWLQVCLQRILEDTFPDILGYWLPPWKRHTVVSHAWKTLLEILRNHTVLTWFYEPPSIHFYFWNTIILN